MMHRPMKHYPSPIFLTLFVFVCAALQSVTRTHAQDKTPSHPLWDKAQLSYLADDREAGHQYLKQLIDQNPGNTETAISCLEQILQREGESNYINPWVKYAAKRLMALEQAGYLAANTNAARAASKAAANIAISQGHLIEAIAELDRLASQNPHDLHYPLLRARAYRKIGSPQTRKLYASLRKQIDPNHPDVRIRERSQGHWQEFNTPKEKLPLPIIANARDGLVKPD